MKYLPLFQVAISTFVLSGFLIKSLELVLRQVIAMADSSSICKMFDIFEYEDVRNLVVCYPEPV